MNRVQSFPPIASKKSRVLILGSMPGAASLKAKEYYAHPGNAFWRIMGKLFGAEPSLPYDERVDRLQLVGVALWDSLQACVRPGSLDASITEEVPNNFPVFFAEHTAITHVFFNGKKSETVFRRFILPSLPDQARITPCPLPSTSSANTRMLFDAKVKAWSTVKKVLS